MINLFIAMGIVLPQKALYGQYKYEQRCWEAEQNI